MRNMYVWLATAGSSLYCACGTPDRPKFDLYAQDAWNGGPADLVMSAVQEWRAAAASAIEPETRPIIDLRMGWRVPTPTVAAFSDGQSVIYRVDYPNAATDDIDQHLGNPGHTDIIPSARAGDDIVIMMFRLSPAGPAQDTLLHRCLLHEIGHLLGLKHVSGYGVMNARTDLASDRVTDADLTELRRVFSPY